MNGAFLLATGEKLTDRDESRRKGKARGGRVSKLKWSSSDSDGDGESSIHFLTKAAKQDVRFHGDQQTVIFLKGPLGFLWCLVIGLFRCCRHSTWGRRLALLVLELRGQDVYGWLDQTWSHFRHEQLTSNLQLYFLCDTGEAERDKWENVMYIWPYIRAGINLPQNNKVTLELI